MAAGRRQEDAPAAPARRMLRRIVDALDTVVLVADAGGRVVVFNRAAERLTGYAAAEAIGRPLGALLLAEPRPDLALRLREALATDPGPLRRELWIRTRDGRRRLVAWSAELIADAEGGAPLILATGADVTEQRRLEGELRERERTLRVVLDAGPIGVARFDRDRILRFANRAYARFYGRQPEEMIGRTGEEIVGAERAARAMPYVEETLAGRAQSFESRVPDAEGAIRTMQVSLVPDRDEAGAVAGFFAFGLDVSDVAEANTRASRLQRQLLDAVEHNAGAVMLVDADDRVVLWNRAYETMFPHQVPIRVGTPFIDILRKAATQTEIHSHPAPEAWVADRLAAHRAADVPFVYEMADGRWLLCLESVTHDGGRMAITIDVTAQKRVEQELARSNRELQQFASVASHDLQEPLRKVQAFGRLLTERYGDAIDETGRGYVERMVDAAERMRRLIDDLMAFSRVASQAEPLLPVDLNAVLRDVLANLELAIGDADARISVEPLPWIEADAGQMRQLFQNLLGNALKYRADDRRPEIAVRARRRGGGWEVSVADNGIGFEPQYAERIFGIFQRLHPRSAYPGTGVGLALCRKIAERHRGSIAATGEPGVGATFAVTLPARHDREAGDASTGGDGDTGGRR